MTYDNELILISQSYTADEIGNQVPDPENEIETKVLCGIKSTTRDEFYKAALSGLKPEIAFVVHAYEYNGEQKVEFNGELYRVIRTYQTGFEEVELVCEKVTSNG